MLTNPPLPPLPNAPSDHFPDFGRLDAGFEAMFLNAAHAADGDFIDDWGAVNTAEALALSSVDDVRLKRCIVDASASVWGMPTMRPLQIKACYCLLHPHHSNSLGVVHWTGGGKTYILWTLGVIVRGIVMIFTPLLMLSADVMHTFKAYNSTWGNVGVYHLDEMIDCNQHIYALFLRSCSSMRQDTSSTFFVFLSLQFLINHRDALKVFLACAKARTLCVIAMDDAHIHVQHGTLFRDDIHAL